MEEIRTKYIPWLEVLHKDDIDDPQIRSEIDSVLCDLKAHIDSNYKRPEGMYSKVRKMIGDKITCPVTIKLARDIIKMTKAEYDAAAAAMRKVVELNNRKQTVFTLDYISQAVGVLRACTTFADRFVFLQLACGARGVELLDSNTSKFYDVGGNSVIKQVGFAKKRGDQASASIIKPLLFTSPSNFLLQLSLLREAVGERGHETRKDIAKSFSTQLSFLCKHLWFQNVVNDNRTGTHINRAIYANVAYKSHGNAGESLTHFVKHVLGHDTMGSAANYMNVAIAFSEDEKLTREARRQEDLFSRDSVCFRNNAGLEVSICKPPVRQMSQEKRQANILFYAHQLQSNGVSVNRANLIAIGFQSKAIRKEMLIPFRDSE